MGCLTTDCIDHINTYMHPQAIIVDASEQEERFFRRGVRAQAKASGNTLIELPVDSAKDLMWLTKLDSASVHSKRSCCPCSYLVLILV